MFCRSHCCTKEKEGGQVGPLCCTVVFKNVVVIDVLYLNSMINYSIQRRF